MIKNIEKAPRVSAIAAIGRNREIGADGGLLWSIPEDLKYFKEVTMGKPVIMGSKTFESIGKALPGRANIVLSNNPEYNAQGCIVAHSLEEAIAIAGENEEEIFIIGGGFVYKQAFDDNLIDRLYLTHVDSDFPEADVFFPKYEGFTKVVKERGGGESETFGYKFVTLERDDSGDEN